MAENINRTGFQSRRLLGSLQINPPSTIGSVFFVDATNGSSTNSGGSWADALVTVDAAVAKCTADKGDIIYLAPWHTEDEAVTVTSGFTLSVDGVSLIGVRQGNQMPTFTLSIADATYTVSGENCRISNIKIESDVADAAIGLTVAATAGGLTLDDCVFTDGAVDEELVIGVNVATLADNLLLANNNFRTVASGGCANAIVLAGNHDDSTLIGNVAMGTYSAGCVLASAASSRNMSLVGNVLVNQSALALALNTNTTGILRRNYLGGTTNTATTLTGVEEMWVHENYITGDIAKSGILDPGVDAD